MSALSPSRPAEPPGESLIRLKHKIIAVLGLVFATGVHAEITVGVIVSMTGPAASIGMPQRNTIDMMPEAISGQSVRYVILDDQSDALQALINMRRLVFDEQVDVVLGSTTTPSSLAMIDIAAESETPMISWAAANSLVAPIDDKKRWVFKTPHNDQHMATAIVAHMSGNQVRTAAFIGFADRYGEAWWSQFDTLAQLRGINLVSNQRFHRTDRSVLAQVQQIIAQRPDAVLIAAAGSPAVLAQKTLQAQGYSGQVYQTHAVAGIDFVQACGRDCEGTFMPASPLLVATQLPAQHPLKKSTMAYVTAYEAAHGAGHVSIFGAYAWDSGVLLQAAVPEALKLAQPGTPAFRIALRDALENVRHVPGAHGIFNMSPSDHIGLDQRSHVMVQLREAGWTLIAE